MENSKRPIRVLDHTIHKFVNVALPADLGRLNRHKENILQYQHDKDWDKLNSEQLNASRTVQQLKSHMKTLDEIRNEVQEDDLRQFDKRVAGIRKKVYNAIESFGMASGVVEFEHVTSDDTHEVEHVFTSLTVDEQSVLVPSDQAASQSWDQLRSDLVELSDITRDLARLVKDQEDGVDEIADNVDSAARNTRGGTINLTQAAGYKAYLYPVGGALLGGVLGGVVGGPIGAVVGIQAASGVAGGLATGVFAGYFGGKAVQKTTKKTTSVELRDMD
ncbi:syntaxin-17-like [Dysidea avara]|uniref:syntaxin-17-like n=1 Tax=Dysidea avara TaxID=196820 RepID=UPI00331F2009